MPALLLLMGFTNLKVNSRNAESLDASLQLMLKPLSQEQRIELMESLFLYVYAEKNNFDGAIHGYENSASQSAVAYVADRRMNSRIKKVNGWGDVSGMTRQESFVYFITEYGVYVNGKSGTEILALAEKSRTRLNQRAGESRVAWATTQIEEIEFNLRRWKPHAPDRRKEISASMPDSNNKARISMDRAKLVGIKSFDSLKGKVYVVLNLEFDARMKDPTDKLAYGVIAYHKDNPSKMMELTESITEMPASGVGRVQHTSKEFIFPAFKGSASIQKNDYHFVPFVKAIYPKSLTQDSLFLMVYPNDVMKYIASNPSGTGGTVMSYCDAAIGQGELLLKRMNAIVGGQDAGRVDKKIYDQGKHHCSSGLSMEAIVNGGAEPYIAPADSPLLSVVSAPSIKPTTSVDVSTPAETEEYAESENDLFAKALGYIRLTKITSFSVDDKPSPQYHSMQIKMKYRVKLHNLSDKPVKRIIYAIVVTSKSNPANVIVLDARAPAWNEQGPLKGVLITSNGEGQNSAKVSGEISENQTDYTFTPFVKSIHYMNGTKEEFVSRNKDILPTIVNKNK